MMTSSNSLDHVTSRGLNVSTLIHFVCIPAALRSTLTSTSVFDFLFCLFVYLFSLLKVGVNRKRTKNKRRPQVVPLGGLLRPVGEANYWNKWWPEWESSYCVKIDESRNASQRGWTERRKWKQTCHFKIKVWPDSFGSKEGEKNNRCSSVTRRRISFTCFCNTIWRSVTSLLYK